MPRSLQELSAIVGAGGSIDFDMDAQKNSREDLLALALEASKKSTIIIRGTNDLTTGVLVHLSEACKGKIQFVIE